MLILYTPVSWLKMRFATLFAATAAQACVLLQRDEEVVGFDNLSPCCWGSHFDRIGHHDTATRVLRGNLAAIEAPREVRLLFDLTNLKIAAGLVLVLVTAVIFYAVRNGARPVGDGKHKKVKVSCILWVTVELCQQVMPWEPSQLSALCPASKAKPRMLGIRASNCQ